MTRRPVPRTLSGFHLPTLALALSVVVLIGVVGALTARNERVQPFEQQLCALPRPWLVRTQRGYSPERSGQIAILPRYPAYLGTAEGGWSHSGPWGYLQRVPLVFYGGGVTEPRVVERPVTLADVAPTLMRSMRGLLRTDDGRALDEVVEIGPRLVRSEPPRLILVVVWDGGGWNTLERWPDAWPNLRGLMDSGVSFTDATVGSSPSVTPSVHTTLGTGVFPWAHGITGIPVRDENGKVVDAFLDGDSGRFVGSATLAERWDEHNGNRARVGMLGYEPWHLGMIGVGAETASGDKDDALWLDRDTNRWITNPKHYRLPPAVPGTPGLERDIDRLDAQDGAVDRAWGSHGILDDVARLEETPAFVTYHGRALRRLITAEGYGSDRITDLLFTNFKQIDRLGHYFNMSSEEVRQALEETDRQLGLTLRFLDRTIGRGRWLTVVTADHGQQPDASDVGGYGIDPKELARDIDREFGPVTRAVWPTEVFLEPDADVSPEEVAEWLGSYTLAENAHSPAALFAGAGRFDPDDRLLAMAVPSALLGGAPCGLPYREAASG